MPRQNIRVGGRVRPVRLAPAATGGGPGDPLLYPGDVHYLGAFRVPNYFDGTDEMSYGGGALGFNPANRSLFIVGHHQCIAEVSIPASIVNSGSLDALATATLLQPFADVLSRLPSPLAGATDGAPIGGLMVAGSRVVGTQYAYFSGANSQAASHFLLDSTTLSAAGVTGLFAVGGGPFGARTLAGSMCPVPAGWRAAMGAPCLTGMGDAPIVSTTSSGPAAFGFDPATVASGTSQAVPYLAYPIGHPLGPYEGPPNPVQSGTTWIGGMAFPDGSGTVLYFGRTGTNHEGYGQPPDWGDANDAGKGPHSLNGEYQAQVWAYRAADLAAAGAGTRSPHDVLPYCVWNPTYPITTGEKTPGAPAFDPSTGRIYVPLISADSEVSGSSLPVIHVFQAVPPSGAVGPVAPVVGTLAATPGPVSPGPIPAGTPTTLTAGNVYAITPGATIAAVDFYLDANGNGTLEVGTDAHLGAGTAAANMPDGSSTCWALTTSTAGMATGTRTAFARATDSDGLTSNVAAYAYTVSHTPAVPTLVATPASASSIGLSWSGSGDFAATSYTLQRSVDLASWSTIAAQAGTTFADTGLASRTYYNYRVSATGAGGTSANSPIVFAQTD